MSFVCEKKNNLASQLIKEANMRGLKRSIFVAIMFVGITAIGQTTNNINNQPNIEVTGFAEKEIVPDEIYITINISERYDGKEKITIETQEKDLKDALEKAGVNIEDFYLSDASSNYIKYKWTKKDVLSESEYVLKVGDAATVGKVFKQLNDLKIRNAYVSKVTHSKIKEFEKELRILAMKEAKAKADYLLNAIGEETGKALEVNEINNIQNRGILDSQTRNDFNTNYYMAETRLIVDLEKSIQFKKIVIKSTIYIKFAIK